MTSENPHSPRSDASETPQNPISDASETPHNPRSDTSETPQNPTSDAPETPHSPRSDTSETPHRPRTDASENPYRHRTDSSFEYKKHVSGPKSGGDRGDREEWVWILDYLPYGRDSDTRPVYMKKPLIHALGDNKLILMELSPIEGKIPQVHIKTHIGGQDEEFIERVKSRITYEELSRGAKMELPIVLEKYIKENEARFIKFFNDATPVSMRQNSLELIPGIGKKLMWDVIEKKKKGPFESFENLKARISGLKDPEKMMVQRIVDELKGGQKYYLFTAKPPQPRHDMPPAVHRPDERKHI